MLEAGLAGGAVGTISAMANVNAGHIRRVYDTRTGTDGLRDARSLTSTRPLIPALKAILASRLADPGWTAVRPPLRPLPVEEGSALAAGLPLA